MEDTLGGTMTKKKLLFAAVLILVLMEDTLGVFKLRKAMKKGVS